MKEWDIVPISTIYQALFDGPHATPTPVEFGHVFLSIDSITPDGRLDLSNPKYISDAEFPRWTKRVTPKAGDIVFSYEATLNRYAIIPNRFDGCLGRRIALIRPDNSKAYYKYLFYYFFTKKWREEVGSYIVPGSTVDRIPIIRFPQFKIALPPIETQRKIAAILSAYDDLIEVNGRRIALLEKMAEELYREWFVRMRFPGHGNVHKAIPLDWEQCKLESILTLEYGKALKEEDRDGGEFPVIGSSGIVGSHSKYLVKGPGIVVGRKGNVGSIIWVPESFSPIDTVYFVQSTTNLRFLYYILRGLNFINNDAAVPGLSRSQAYSIAVLFPPNELIEEFVHRASPMLDHCDAIRRSIGILKHIRDRLLSRLMSGSLDVENLDIAFPPSMEGEI